MTKATKNSRQDDGQLLSNLDNAPRRLSTKTCGMIINTECHGLQVFLLIPIFPASATERITAGHTQPKAPEVVTVSEEEFP